MKLEMTADRFRCLTHEVQEEGLEWCEAVAPNRWVLSAEVLDEGRCRVKALLGTRGHQIDDDVFRSPDGSLEIITRAIYTNVTPPPAVLAAMVPA